MNGMKVKIGVIGSFGTVREHLDMIQQCGGEGTIIKQENQLHEVDGLVIPSSESTAIGIFLEQNQLIKPIQKVVQSGLPLFATGGGLTLLAKQVIPNSEISLQLMDIVIDKKRCDNQFLEVTLPVARVGNEGIPAVFIRSPKIIDVGEQVEILAKYKRTIVAVKERNLLGTTFLPELTKNVSLMKLFFDMIRKSKF